MTWVVFFGLLAALSLLVGVLIAAIDGWPRRGTP